MENVIKDLTEKIKYIENKNKEEQIISQMSQELEEQTFIKTTRSPNMINLKCRLWLDNNKFLDLTALLDAGATKSVISYSLVPIKYHKELTNKLLTRTIEARLLQIKYYIEPTGI